MRQASNLKNLNPDLLLPGLSINTSRSDYRGADRGGRTLETGQ
jgi:hypothetical protein